MSSETIYSNLESFEGTVNGSENFTLTLYSRRVIVTNDSGSSDLLFYPKGTNVNSYITLKPTESITLERFRSPTLGITGTNVPYRIWVYG